MKLEVGAILEMDVALFSSDPVLYLLDDQGAQWVAEVLERPAPDRVKVRVAGLADEVAPRLFPIG